MIKIQALNEESDEDSDSEEISKEALEQIALQQYVKALELQRKGNTTDAIQLLKDLLDTELLYDVKKPGPKEKPSGPLLNLKYLCYKNLGSMSSAAGEIDEAIDYYTAASELDETDVSLWHRLGLVCMQAKRHEMALYAFQRGVERNPRHWPCLDKIVTLLLGIDDKEQCIITIYEALNLDPDYFRGIVYRRHIYTVFKHMKEYMEYINPMYKWNEKDDGPIDEAKAENLIKEADQIYEEYIEQQKSEKTHIPNVQLQKPLSSLTWEAVGNSLIHMHKYMTEQSISHASILEITSKLEDSEQEKHIAFNFLCQEPKKNDDSVTKHDEMEVDNEKPADVVSEVENTDVSDKEKPTTDTEKVESDVEMTEPTTENETRKKPPARRRGCAVGSLQLWEWCKNRRSGRKKQARQDDNIYDNLRGMVPKALIPEVVKNKETSDNGEKVEITDLNNLFEDKAKDKLIEEAYFGSEQEQKDVQLFVSKYIDNKKDIIDLLRDYLDILASKWRIKWPDNLSKVFNKANECYMNHIDIPACTNDNKQDLLHFTSVNLLVEELCVNDKLNAPGDKTSHNLEIVESLEIILTLKPHIFSSVDCLETILRQLWLKTHIHILNKCEEFALDCLYQLLHEFEAMDEHHETYSLEVINFTYKHIINKVEITEYITFLERNSKLSTVIGLYNRGCYDEVLSIITDSFDHCKTLARKQEGEMSLDFAVQLSLILDTYWALDRVDCCFKWSFICLHEALKHYFRFTSGTPEYEKWTLTVLKILSCIEHIFNVEGLSCLDFISQKELSQGLEDLIRIIGHQVETNSPEMPFNSVSPWIIMHYILQREEDQGRGRDISDSDKMSCDDVPNPLMLLFIAHEQLGSKGWCCHTNGKLLYFILDTVVPRLRSPSLAKSLEQVCQYMEQCVYCLFAHPDKKKSKMKYIVDHNVTPYDLDWKRAQQLYEIYKPLILPALEGKLPGITSDTEALFLRILSLLPAELNPQKYEPEMDKYIKGLTDKLPSVPPLLPYKMKDIYFLLGDYYFKKEENKMSIKYNTLDIIINNERLESWAQISLAIAVILERTLNSCKNLNCEREVLNPAKSAMICFKRSLLLDPSHCNVLIEYGNFTYYFHSFCSRLLKQASESLSMEDFEALERQKEDLLDTTFKCFKTVIEDLNNSNDSDKTNEESWLFYYMLGKVAEKKNKPPSLYLNYYMQGVKSLEERDATYPLKINYSSPSPLCFEVLEFHYRIHASILKYIEQHENKPIPISVGKVFKSCISQWQNGPFAKKAKKETVTEAESELKEEESQSFQAGNILKRSISDAGEEDTIEARKLKLESAAAKVRRSASYDTERINAIVKEPLVQNKVPNSDVKGDNNVTVEIDQIQGAECTKETGDKMKCELTDDKNQKNIVTSEKSKDDEKESKEESSSSSSSSESSSESSSDSSSDSSRDSDSSSKSDPDAKPLTEDDIMKIVSACLDALEDCASRFSPHYKAIYRLAHYHFYYKKGKDIERCRDLMLLTFTSRCGQKLSGLFSERKTNNFFNNIWKVPLAEVERAGGFAFHMNRAVLLTMEILKEIDDNKTLLDLSLHLQRVPEPDKKYLRDSDREELAQQAFSLCVQSLKGQLLKFSQQADLKSNDVERQALKCLMLDIYKAYQRAQKQPSNSKQFTNLLIDAYKLVTTTPITENMNLVDLSMKYCQMLLRQQAAQPTLEKSQNIQKKQTTRIVESSKLTTITTQSKSESKTQTSNSSSVLPKMSTHDMAAALQNYMLNDPVLSQQTAAAISLSYLSNMSALAGYSSLQNSLKSLDTSSHSFQSEFYRQFYRQNFPSYHHQQQKKQKRASKPLSSRPPVTGLTIQKPTKSISSSSTTTSASTSAITSTQKSLSTPLTPSMGTVLPTLPPSLTANLPSYSSHSLTSNSNTVPQAHMSTASNTSSGNHPKPPMPHQQVSPGKTLQEKLAEKQKSNPILPKCTPQDISTSLSKLPSSLTVTKTSKQPNQVKKPEAKKSLAFENQVRPKPITSDEIIVLDDD